MARATPSYATPDDLAIFGGANAVSDSLTVAEKARYLAAASDRADGLIQNHHALPLIAWGDDLREAVCSIAVWSIMSRRVGFNPEQGADLAIRKNYDDAMALLGQFLVAVDSTAAIVAGTDIHGSRKRHRTP